MSLPSELAAYELIIDRFLAGRLPRMSHARHLDLANILVHLPHGRALVHLGLQITAIRAGVPEKYSREVTDYWLNRIDGTLPPLDAFGDVHVSSSHLETSRPGEKLGSHAKQGCLP